MLKSIIEKINIEYKKSKLNKKHMIEMTYALKGDWFEGVEKLDKMTSMMKLKWNLIEELPFEINNRKLELRQLKNSLEFRIGYWETFEIETKLGIEEKDYFVEVLMLSLKRMKSLESKLGYNKLVFVKGVAVLDNFNMKGLATYMYKKLTELGYSILGSSEQFFGTRKLYSRLSKDSDLQIDLVDILHKRILEKNIILHQGDKDFDKSFDKRLWQYEEENIDISFIRAIITKLN